jgi:hypothetical protein
MLVRARAWWKGDLVDRHVSGVVYVEHELSAVRSWLGVHPGADRSWTPTGSVAVAGLRRGLTARGRPVSYGDRPLRDLARFRSEASYVDRGSGRAAGLGWPGAPRTAHYVNLPTPLWRPKHSWHRDNLTRRYVLYLRVRFHCRVASPG